jgi:23S rRNA (uracil1939-C5)-methyltransferase
LPRTTNDATLATVKAGETAHVIAHGITLEGQGVATLEGREISCPGLFPGEAAAVRIEAVSRQHARAHATLVTLESAHPKRRSAPCMRHVSQQAGGCTGCPLMELSEDAQAELKAQLLRERFELPVERVEPALEALGYRWSSKRIAFGRPGALALGSYARGTHTPVEMAGCLVDHPLLVSVFSAIVRAANELGIAPFDERTGQGDLRYVWAKTNGSDCIVTLVVSDANARAARELAARELPCAGVLVSVQEGRGNALRGSPPVLVRGVAELGVSLMNQRVEVGALGFLQPNPRVAEACYAALTSWPSERPAELAFDLYAGAGITTRALRARFREVMVAESYPESALALGVAPESAETFLARFHAHAAGRTPDLVVANPPRKGLGASVCAELARLNAAELRIMSCGPEGLARDLKQLAEAGYTVQSVLAFDTLPQTPHVELVATLVL